MKPKIYVETTVVSYFTARPSRDLVIAGRQEITREVWPRVLEKFEVFVSVLVLQEIKRGDAQAAEERLEVLKYFPVLDITQEIEGLAQRLLSSKAIPKEYPEDAVHVAAAAMNGIDFITTWNFTHINNAFTRSIIREVITDAGFCCPEICSPDEIFGDLND